MNKKLVIGLVIVILIVVGFGIYEGFFREEELVLTTFKAVRGNLRQEISEIGAVRGNEIGLNFKGAGRIEKIYIEVGQNVKKGDILARLEIDHSKIRLQGEKISTQTSLVNANQNLVDVKKIADDSLKAAYANALNILMSSNLKLENTFNTVDLIQKRYFFINDQEGIRVREAKSQVKNALDRADGYLKIAKINPTNENIDVALLETREALEITSRSLTFIQDTNREARYKYVVSSVSKASLDTEMARIITALSGIVNSQQAISSIRIGNEARINTAKASIVSIENLLVSIQEQLAAAETEIFSPIDGKIIEINKETGEIFMPGAKPFISLIPTTPFQMEVAIHEEDVVLVEVGNPVEIEIFAFPDQIFKGMVASIELMPDLTKKTATGIIFYQVVIDFKEIPEGLRLGMTGDVVIITDLKENILIIPEDVIFEKEGVKMIQVMKNGLIENREVKIGLVGDDDMIEVISGLNEGEEIIKNPKVF